MNHRANAIRTAVDIARAQLAHGYIDDALHTLDHATRADDQLRAGEAAADPRAQTARKH